jgi:lipopolysaccharide biosynthesis glycosyltransferase
LTAMDEKPLRYVPVVFCFDKNYSDHAAVSIYSLYANSKTPIKVYCVVPATDISAIPSIGILREKYSINIEIVPGDVSVFDGWKVSGHVTSAAYIRILIPRLIEEKKVIYLDSDLIVLADLLELYKTPVEKVLLAGAIDQGGAAAKSTLPRDKSDTYINSGVLVLNLEALRKDNSIQKCSEINFRYKDYLGKWPDQDIINKYAENKKKILDPKWNRPCRSNQINSKDWEEIKNNSNIIHFIGDEKPWTEWCNPRVAEFWWGWANKVGLDSIKPIKITLLNQTLSLVRSLDLNEEFKRSGLLKNDVISFLINQLNQRS